MIKVHVMMIVAYIWCVCKTNRNQVELSQPILFIK